MNEVCLFLAYLLCTQLQFSYILFYYIHSVVNVSTVLPLAQLMFLSPGRNAVVASLTPDNVLQTLGFSSGGLLMIFSSIADR